MRVFGQRGKHRKGKHKQAEEEELFVLSEAHCVRMALRFFYANLLCFKIILNISNIEKNLYNLKYWNPT